MQRTAETIRTGASTPGWRAPGLDDALLPFVSGIRAGLLSLESLYAEAECFWRSGYVIVRDAFSATEMEVARRAVAGNARMNQRVERLKNRVREGKHPSFETIFVWNDTGGGDLFAKLTRSYKIFDRLCYFFDDHVYGYHSKIALKYGGIPGFRYHQDYFYWYTMGNLLPDMASAQIAIDQSTRENGCLRILEGSHRLGRVDHKIYPDDEDSGVEETRLRAIQARCTEVYVELAPGDLVIFHCNTLHGSSDNSSADSRIALLGCYNTKRNSPYETNASGHPAFSTQSSIIAPVIATDEHAMPDFDARFNDA